MSEELEIVQEQTPMLLIGAAIQKGMDIETMKVLYELNKDHEKGEAKKAFKKAFSKFQSKKPIISKTEKGHNCMYAPLPKIQQAVDPILSKFGLSYRFDRQDDPENVMITCIISHESGHEERTSLPAPLDLSGNKSKIHGLGSTVSYLMRYTLSLALGISSDKDLDGDPKNKEVKQDLTPSHTKWDDALEAITKGTGTIEGIKKKYSLSSSNEQILIDAIDVDELQLLFDLVEDKINPTDKPLIERIIKEEERVNYSKVLFTLNKLRNES